MLRWQFQWIGAQLQNLRILVCPSCYDKPNEGLRTIVLPPDPIPISNPRPELFVAADNPISELGFAPGNMWLALNQGGANIGNMTGGGGLDAPYWGEGVSLSASGMESRRPKPSNRSAYLAFANGGGGKGTPSFIPSNWIGKNWSAGPGPTAPASLALPPVGYAVSKVVVTAPSDMPFLSTGSSNATIGIFGSSDSINWTVMAFATPAGAIGEVLTFSTSTISNAGPWPYFAVQVSNASSGAQVGISGCDIYVTGSSGVGELGA